MKKIVNLWRGGVLLVLFSAVGIVASADAAVTTYTSQALFNSALTASYTDNFDDKSGITINTPLTISGGTPLFTAQASGAGSTVFYLVKGQDSAGVGLSSSFPAEQIFITLGANVTAAGGYFYLTDTGGSVVTGNYHVSVNDGSSTTLTATSSGPVFFGFTKSSVSDFTKLTLSNDSSGRDVYISFDDLTIGTITTVPEPSTWMAIGFLGLTLAGRFGRAIWIRNRPR